LSHKKMTALAMALLLSMAGAGAIQAQTKPAGPALGPGGLPELAGTGWKQLADKKMVGVPVHLFCRSGRWHLVLSSGRIGPIGRYSTSGSQITIDDGGGTVGHYRMAWNAAETTLSITEGSTTLRLKYNGTTECK
jgi:hypothetical protein